MVEPGQQVELYPHQKEGCLTLAAARNRGHGMCVLDEMGLGKTFTMLSLLYLVWRKVYNNSTAAMLYLAVVPVSVLKAWFDSTGMCNAEFAQHVAVFHEETSFDEFLAKHQHKGIILVITTPGKILSEWNKDGRGNKLFSTLWDSVILDEADQHRNMVKPPNQQRKRTVKKAAEDRLMDLEEDKKKSKTSESNKIARALFQLKRRFGYALTGTPINNSIYDLATLALFLNHGPASGGGLSQACAEWWHGNEHHDDLLLAWCNQYCIRRLAATTLKPALPPLHQHAICLNMSAIQAKIHDLLIKQCESSLVLGKSKDKTKRGHLFTLIQRLRQNANSPYALPRSLLQEIGVESDLNLETKLSPGLENFDAKLKDMLLHSPKLAWIFEKVADEAEKPATQRRKIVIFAQEMRFLRVIERLVRAAMQPAKSKTQAATPLMYEGKMSPKDRQAAISAFQSSENTEQFVMLVSMHAGNIGITLHAGTIGIVADVSFNPVDAPQALCRLHRIGQKKPVDAFSLIVKEEWGIEQWMLSVVRKKVEAAARVIKDVGKQIPLFQKMSGGRTTGRGFTFADLRQLVNINQRHRACVAREKALQERVVRAKMKSYLEGDDRAAIKPQPIAKLIVKNRPLVANTPAIKAKESLVHGLFGQGKGTRFDQAPKMWHVNQDSRTRKRIMNRLDKMSKKS